MKTPVVLRKIHGTKILSKPNSALLWRGKWFVLGWGFQNKVQVFKFLKTFNDLKTPILLCINVSNSIFKEDFCFGRLEFNFKKSFPKAWISRKASIFLISIYFWLNFDCLWTQYLKTWRFDKFNFWSLSFRILTFEDCHSWRF